MGNVIMCKVTKVTMSKVTMGRMVVTGMLAMWSPGGCVPCGAGQPPLLSLAPTPKPPTPSFPSHRLSSLQLIWYWAASSLEFDFTLHDHIYVLSQKEKYLH